MQLPCDLRVWVCVLTGSRAEGSPLCIVGPCGASSSSWLWQSWCVWSPSVALGPSHLSMPAHKTGGHLHYTNNNNYIINHIEAFVVSCCEQLLASNRNSVNSLTDSIHSQIAVIKLVLSRGSLTSFLRSFSPALELSSCMLKKARIPSSFGCK